MLERKPITSLKDGRWGMWGRGITYECRHNGRILKKVLFERFQQALQANGGKDNFLKTFSEEKYKQIGQKKNCFLIGRLQG